jgi:hypothetical protein
MQSRRGGLDSVVAMESSRRRRKTLPPGKEEELGDRAGSRRLDRRGRGGGGSATAGGEEQDTAVARGGVVGDRASGSKEKERAVGADCGDVVEIFLPPSACVDQTPECTGTLHIFLSRQPTTQSLLPS